VLAQDADMATLRSRLQQSFAVASNISGADADVDAILPLIIALGSLRAASFTGGAHQHLAHDPSNTMKCCAGVRLDLASLRARYASDWREGLLDGGAPARRRALAAGVFAFFAQAAPAIAFAGFLSERTRGECGVAAIAASRCPVVVRSPRLWASCSPNLRSASSSASLLVVMHKWLARWRRVGQQSDVTC
jgi:hypothetical protein